MTTFTDMLHGGELTVWLRPEGEIAAGRYSYSWVRQVPTQEQPEASITLTGTLPEPMPGKPNYTIESASVEVIRVIKEVIGKKYPSFLKDD